LLTALREIHDRVVHIELKIDSLASNQAWATDFSGHADQRYGHITYSQHGEDLVFASIFDHLRLNAPSYLDVGAHHPLNCNNTALIYRRGGRGVNVEANPDVMPEFHRLRPEDKNVNVGVGPHEGTMTLYRIDAFSGRNTFSRAAADEFVKTHPQFAIVDTIEVKLVTIESLVDKYCEGSFPDLLSIDTEGLDYAILESASFANGRPRVLCVEGTSAAGTVDHEISELAQYKGFVPYVRMGENLIFLDEDTADCISIRRLGKK
jgi:FkbM family methyltransferase